MKKRRFIRLTERGLIVAFSLMLGTVLTDYGGDLTVRAQAEENMSVQPQDFNKEETVPEKSVIEEMTEHFIDEPTDLPDKNETEMTERPDTVEPDAPADGVTNPETEENPENGNLPDFVSGPETGTLPDFISDPEKGLSVEGPGGSITYEQGSMGNWNPAAHRYENKTSGNWIYENGGNEILIRNNGEEEVCLNLVYQPSEQHTEIQGSFTDASGNKIYNICIPANSSEIVYLQLSGEPDRNLYDEIIGSVTYQLTEQVDGYK